MAKAQQNRLLRIVFVLVGGWILVAAGDVTVAKKADHSPKSQAVGKVAPGSAPVMGYLETKDRTITILGGSKFTVKTKAGKVLAEGISLEKLQASFPDLYRLVDRSVAKSGKLSAPRLEGSLR